MFEITVIKDFSGNRFIDICFYLTNLSQGDRFVFVNGIIYVIDVSRVTDV